MAALNPAPEKRKWQDVVAQKRALREALIAPFENDGENDSEITGIDDARVLSQSYASGKLASGAVIRAYIRAAIRAHRQTNCLTEIMFEGAITRAAYLNNQLSRTGALVGPLHGVPVSVKDQCDVKGYDSTLGYVGRAFKPAATHSVLVTMLEQLGAIVICKTNLPQSIMWAETDNPLFGLTTHPLDARYTPGGSSGGESGLLACQGSLLGWGTDIGGSIRMPAHMTGIYGFKPSSARLPYLGIQVSTDGQEHVPSSIGPMARSLDTIHLAMKSLCEARPWQHDAKCAPMGWREDASEEVLGRPLKLAVLVDDGVVRPHPPIIKVMQKVAKLLRAAGHLVFDWDPSLHADIVDIMDEYFTIDGGEDIRRDVEAGGEPFIPAAEKLVTSRASSSIYDYWQLNKRKRDMQNAYLDKWLNYVAPNGENVRIDAIITPPMPHAAVPHGSCHWVGYTNVWNLLDYPALVIPAGRVGDLMAAGDDCEDCEDASGAVDASLRGRKQELNDALWEERRHEMVELNLPVGLQIICQRMEDEKTLGIGKVVDDVIRRRG